VEEVVVVIAAPHAASTRAAADALGLAWVVNSAPEEGMASSVAVGFQYAIDNFSSASCWLWPVDSPAIESISLAHIAGQGGAGRIATPSFEGKGGHPSLVGREIWPELVSCRDEAEGARSVFRREPTRRVYVEVEDPGVAFDADLPADLIGAGC